MNHIFAIVIGDWSDDGHGHSETFHYKSNKVVLDVREAYFAAMKLHEGLSPEDFCSDYEDSIIDAEDMQQILAAFPGLNNEAELDDDGTYYVGPEFMAAFTAEFIKSGDPELKLELMPQALQPTLHFYGKDEKKRHIGFIGYGTMGS